MRKSEVAPAMIAEVAKDLQLGTSGRQLIEIKTASSLRESGKATSADERIKSTQGSEVTAVEQVAARGLEPSPIIMAPRAREPATAELPQKVDKIVTMPLPSRDQSIQAEEPSVEAVPAWFFDYMIQAFADAMGPIASFILKDRIAVMGETMESFPKPRLVQLVEEASLEILDDRLRAGFQRLMFSEIHTLDAARENRAVQGQSS
jgi:hypothetical protein